MTFLKFAIICILISTYSMASDLTKLKIDKYEILISQDVRTSSTEFPAWPDFNYEVEDQICNIKFTDKGDADKILNEGERFKVVKIERQNVTRSDYGKYYQTAGKDIKGEFSQLFYTITLDTNRFIISCSKNPSFSPSNPLNKLFGVNSCYQGQCQRVFFAKHPIEVSEFLNQFSTQSTLGQYLKIIKL